MRITVLLLLMLATTMMSGCHKGSAKQPLPPEVRIAEAESRVYTVVQDPERADQIAEALRQMMALVEDEHAANTASQERLLALHRDPRSPRTAFESLFQEQRQRSTATFDELLKLRMRLITLTSPEEWDRLTAP